MVPDFFKKSSVEPAKGSNIEILSSQRSHLLDHFLPVSAVGWIGSTFLLSHLVSSPDPIMVSFLSTFQFARAREGEDDSRLEKEKNHMAAVRLTVKKSSL